MVKLRRFLKNHKGFILMDSIVGVLVLAIGLAALAVLYTQGIKLLHKSDTREKAVQVAADRLELLKSMDGQEKVKLQDMVDTLNAETNVTTQPDKDNNPNEIFTVNITPTTITNLTNISGNKSNISVDEYVYPVTVTVKWNSPETETIVMSTYVTTSD